MGCNVGDTKKLFDVALVRAAATHTHSALIRSYALRFQMNTLLEQSAEGVRLPLDVPALSCTQVIGSNRIIVALGLALRTEAACSHKPPGQSAQRSISGPVRPNAALVIYFRIIMVILTGPAPRPLHVPSQAAEAIASLHPDLDRLFHTLRDLAMVPPVPPPRHRGKCSRARVSRSCVHCWEGARRPVHVLCVARARRTPIRVVARRLTAGGWHALSPIGLIKPVWAGAQPLCSCMSHAALRASAPLVPPRPRLVGGERDGEAVFVAGRQLARLGGDAQPSLRAL
jgi:hypothetical protein